MGLYFSLSVASLCLYVPQSRSGFSDTLKRVSQTSCTCMCLALTKHFPPALANMLCVLSTHADAHMTALLAISEIYMIMPDTGKFEVQVPLPARF